MATVPKGFAKIAVDGYGPNGRGVTYRVTAEDGRTYVVKRHHWVAPSNHWGWAAKPEAGGKTLYEDTLLDLELVLFPDRVEKEGR